VAHRPSLMTAADDIVELAPIGVGA
jgi:hypothetical protein